MTQGPQITVSIGGNNAYGEPLAYRTWRKFRHDLVDLLTFQCGGTVELTTLGISHSSYGRERSYTVGVSGIHHQSYPKFKVVLAHLADLYDQESIAVIAADPIFIQAEGN